METITGYVEKIVFRNSENFYTVATVSMDGEELTVVGYFSELAEGNYLEAEGTYTEHKVYGIQFSVSSYSIKEPETAVAIEKYLASGIVKGIGKVLAARIVALFDTDALEIMEREPERLAEVKGITLKKAKEIAASFEEKKEFRETMFLLSRYGISNTMAMKLFKEYGTKVIDIIKENPYRLADDIDGIGFKTADEIAMKSGLPMNSDKRYKAGILYGLTQAAGNGHTYLPYEELEAWTVEMLEADLEAFEKNLTDLILERRVIRKKEGETDRIYNINFYYMELNVARKLVNLDVRVDSDKGMIEKKIKEIEKKSGLLLEGKQREAVVEAAESGFVVITGGPGTGKTTTINMIIRLFEEAGMEILLAAPTGRAAKRMTETTEREAQTIHRLLELNGNPEEGRTMRFERNDENPLEADVIIIDEMSMVDIYLMYSLLKAVPSGTRLILVGDVNQLPSVGPGTVLRDIIDSKEFNVVRLDKIFRQAAESDIITNAHRIHAGEKIRLDNNSKDFFMLRRDDVRQVEQTLLYLIMTKLPPYVKADPFDIQVLTPMRKGELGVINLNKVMQKYMNPESPEKREKKWGDTIFRERDKVMQIKNDYQLEWRIFNKYGLELKKGSGIFNGDCGIIKEINEFAETVTVEFEEGKIVEYPMSSLDELELAYAVTIHKSQGSEYPAVVMPLLNGPGMLLNRNLLYTAVTRAKRCVTIVGREETVHTMIENESELRRYSGLKEAIGEMRAADSLAFS